MAGKTPVLGIDFGTTNTSAAWVDDRGLVRMVPVSEVETALPTAIWFGSKDRFVVGAGARQHLLDDPANTVHGFKRMMGRAFKSEFVTRLRDNVSYQVVEGDDGLAAVSVHGDVKPLRDLAFHVFSRMLELAQANVHKQVDQCVLTVPSHWGWRQRSLVRTAAEMAGWDVRALVNEPTSAALHVTRQPGIRLKTALIYDLGGGTFDVTLIQLQGSMVKVLGSGGDAFLGGADFDARLAQSLVRRFQEETGLDITSQSVVMQRVLFASETAKMMLSTEESAPVRVLFVGEQGGRPLDLEYTLNRNMLEMLVAPLIERTVGAIDEVVQRAGLKPADVDGLILVGRQTRMPAVQRRIYTLYKGTPANNPTPELSVPSGAAWLGAHLEDFAGPPLADVISVPIWVMVPGAMPRVVLAAGTAVPAVGRIAVEPPPGGAPSVLWLYEALEATSVDRDMLGSIRLDPAMLALGPVTVEVTMKANFDMELYARAASGAREKVTLTPPKPRR